MRTVTAASLMIALAVAGQLCCLAADSHSTTVVNVSRSDGIFLVESVSRIDASRELAWEVLTGYDAYAEYVPDMEYSRRISDSPRRIEQLGAFRALFFRKSVHVVLEITENPPDHISFRAIEGNLRELATDVRIFSSEGQVVLSYSSRIDPDFWVPPLIGKSLLRAAVYSKLAAVAAEIDRRARQETPR